MPLQPLSHRLQALLTPEPGSSGPPSSVESEDRTDAPPAKHRAMRGAIPVIGRPLTSSSAVDVTQVASTSAAPLRQRPSIKVRIITWNMHDSLPKGDLELLLGKAGQYVAPEPGWDISVDSEGEDGNREYHDKSRSYVVGQEKVPRADRVPPLPHDDSHPYHLLVIAGQECPWGDGKRLATSVGMAGELGDIGKQKTRSAKEKPPGPKDSSKMLSLSPNPNAESSTALPTPAKSSTRDGDGDSFPFGSPPTSNAPVGMPLPSPWIGGSQIAGLGGSASNAVMDDDKLAAWPAIGGKGWSDLCEDWLCKNQTSKRDRTMSSGARLARALSTANASRSITPRESMIDLQTRSAAVTPELSRAASPIGISLSAPGTPNQSTFEIASFADATSPSNEGVQGSPISSRDRRSRLVPKLSLKHLDLARKHSSAAKAALEDPNSFANSPVIDSPSVLSTSTSMERPSALSASLSSGNLLSVPTMPAVSRISSTNSATSMTRAGSRDPSPALATSFGADLHIQPPTPSRSPSPCPEDERFMPNFTKAPTDGTPKSLGPYELVIKERMMGCYMAVYVWRGCKDRIRGASRSHVKSGLLAGRLGNKGGVGISIKLGTARLLFVNAHLAAHEDKVALRLSNVARIKAALKVDTFLPSTDPRSKIDDITEQFDHCFWFGDLNFRIDISRQHADWLLMHKKYDQALAFDQLGKVLKEGSAFKGFAEAPIHFPPTYKYDVLKTLRIKRSKTMASVKAPVDVPGMKSTGSDIALARVAGAIPEECDSHTDQDEAVCTATCASAIAALVDADTHTSCSDAEADMLVTGLSPDKLSRADKIARHRLNKAVESGEHSDDDQLSVSSSAFDSVGSSSSYAASYSQHQNRFSQQATTAAGREREQELEDQRVLHENTAAAQGPKLFSQGAAIKAKIKLFGMVRTAAAVNLKEKLSSANETERKWLAMRSSSPRKSSFVADDLDDSVQLESTDGAASSAEDDGANVDRLVRSTSRTKRAGLRTAKAQRDAKYPHLTDATAEQIDFLEAQPYDTSSKQRVPSWCDRVLFRSTVPADSDDSDSERDARRSGQHDSRRASKFSNALSHALAAPRRSVVDRKLHTNPVQPIAVLSGITDSNNVRQVTFGEDKDKVEATGLPQPQPPARAHTSPAIEMRATSSKRDSPSSTAARKRPTSGSQTPDKVRAPHLLQRFLHPGKIRNTQPLTPSLTVSGSTSPTSSPGLWTQANESIGDLSSRSHKVRGLGLAGLDSKALSSVDLPSQLEERERAFDGAKAQIAMQLPRSESRQVVIPPRMSSATATGVVPTKGDARKPALPRSVSAEVSSTKASETTTPDVIASATTSQTSSWMDSISSHLPSFLVPAISALRPSHGQPAATPPEIEPAQTRSPLLGPRKGQIECLLYKSLDDREMRLLEGRSDHRPVIFVGAIGI